MPHALLAGGSSDSPLTAVLTDIRIEKMLNLLFGVGRVFTAGFLNPVRQRGNILNTVTRDVCPHMVDKQHRAIVSIQDGGYSDVHHDLVELLAGLLQCLLADFALRDVLNDGYCPVWLAVGIA